MATEILRPNAAGDLCQFSGQTGAVCPNHYQNVDEEVHDGLTTQNNTHNADEIDLYALADSALDAGTPINKVTLYTWCRYATATYVHGYIGVKSGGTEYWGSEITFPSSVFAEYTREYVTNPKTGSAWTVAEINALQVGAKVEAGATNGLIITQAYVEVDYSFEGSLSTAIGLVTVLSPQKDLLRTHSAIIGLVAVLNVGKELFRSFTTAIGLVPILSAQKNLLRSFATEIGLLAPHAWLPSWDKRIKLTIDNGDIDAALSDFPILVHLSTSSGRNNDDVSRVFDELTLDANRKKIAITTSDGITQCYVEIVKWDDANEKAWLWVKVPSIASDADTDLYLYYDKDHADNTDYVGDTNSTPAENVWADGYFITHSKDDPDNAHIRDSSSYSSDGAKKAANQPTEVAGDKTAYAQDFDPTNPDYIEIPADQTQLDFTSEDFSIIARIKLDLLPTISISEVYYRGRHERDGWYFYVRDIGYMAVLSSQFEAYQKTSSSVGDIVADTWYTIGFSRSGAAVTIYKNGVDVTNTPGTHIDPTTCARSALIGINYNKITEALDGKMEFLGIFGGVALTPAFHKAFDQSITDDLLAFGAEEVTLSRLVTFGRTLTTEIGLVATLSASKNLFRSFTTAIALVAVLSVQKNLFRAFTTAIGLAPILSAQKNLFRAFSAAIGLPVTLSVQKNLLRSFATVIGFVAKLRWTTSQRRRIASVGDNREISTTGENRDREAF